VNISNCSPLFQERLEKENKELRNKLAGEKQFLQVFEYM
jgi:hypothetical protein